MMNRARLLFSFSGRIERADYWRAALLYTLILVALMVAMMIYISIARQSLAEGARQSPVLPALGGLLVVAFLVSTFAVATKRLHDRDKSAWWLIPFNVGPFAAATAGDIAGGNSLGIAAAAISVGLSLWGLVELGFLNGSAGGNAYGPDPRTA